MYARGGGRTPICGASELYRKLAHSTRTDVRILARQALKSNPRQTLFPFIEEEGHLKVTVTEVFWRIGAPYPGNHCKNIGPITILVSL
jgi:hypothetical protein